MMYHAVIQLGCLEMVDSERLSLCSEDVLENSQYIKYNILFIYIFFSDLSGFGICAPFPTFRAMEVKLTANLKKEKIYKISKFCVNSGINTRARRSPTLQDPGTPLDGLYNKQLFVMVQACPQLKRQRYTNPMRDRDTQPEFHLLRHICPYLP